MENGRWSRLLLLRCHLPPVTGKPTFSSRNCVGVAPNNVNGNARPTVHIGGRRMLPCTVCSKQRVHHYTQEATIKRL